MFDNDVERCILLLLWLIFVVSALILCEWVLYGASLWILVRASNQDKNRNINPVSIASNSPGTCGHVTVNIHSVVVGIITFYTNNIVSSLTGRNSSTIFIIDSNSFLSCMLILYHLFYVDIIIDSFITIYLIFVAWMIIFSLQHLSKDLHNAGRRHSTLLHRIVW